MLLDRCKPASHSVDGCGRAPRVAPSRDVIAHRLAFDIDIDHNSTVDFALFVHSSATLTTSDFDYVV